MKTINILAIPEFVTLFGMPNIPLRKRFLNFMRGQTMPSETEAYYHDFEAYVAYEGLPIIYDLITKDPQECCIDVKKESIDK